MDLCAGSYNKCAGRTMAVKLNSGFGESINNMVDVMYNLLLYTVMGVLGGCGVAGLHALFEHLWYKFLEYLHQRGHIQRLAPSIPVTTTLYRKESFWAVAIGPMPITAFIFAYRHGFMSRCQFSGDILGSFQFTWTVMVLHDAYFFAIHTMLHCFKSLYTKIHQWHHSTFGDLTVFSTAYGDFFDLVLTFFVFYSGVVVYIYQRPAWNPIDVVYLLWTMTNVDLMGHCGYKLPLWVTTPASLGVLVTPLAQRPKHHYIHHLDPRFNRSLYFTWWDRLAGTFREDHPKVTTDQSGDGSLLES